MPKRKHNSSSVSDERPAKKTKQISEPVKSTAKRKLDFPSPDVKRSVKKAKTKVTEENKYLIECPTVYDGMRHDTSLFLAGGITGCPDWQKEMIKMLHSKMPELVIMNPRRATFNVKDVSMTEKQVKWEFDHLRLADIIVFWFPYSETSVCPIALFELGKYCHLDGFREIVVGCDPKYIRKTDVELQLKLQRGNDFVIHSSLKSMVKAVQELWQDEVA